MKPEERAIIEMVANEGKQVDHEQYTDHKTGTVIDYYTVIVNGIDNKELVYDITAHDGIFVYCNFRGIRSGV